jgi:hypothetical protein
MHFKFNSTGKVIFVAIEVKTHEQVTDCIDYEGDNVGKNDDYFASLPER